MRALGMSGSAGAAYAAANTAALSAFDSLRHHPRNTAAVVMTAWLKKPALRDPLCR